MLKFRYVGNTKLYMPYIIMLLIYGFLNIRLLVRKGGRVMEYSNLVPYLRKLAKSLDESVGEDIRSKVLEGCETITAKTSKNKQN